LYDRKTPITAAEILDDRVVPFYDEHAIRLSRMLTDRGTEFCGTQSHEYELYLAVEDIDHSRTKTKSPQTNGICERFHRTVLDEFYRVAFRKRSITPSTSYRPTSMLGLSNTICSVLIRAAGASARPDADLS
jgi:transposase InsO family protein